MVNTESARDRAGAIRNRINGFFANWRSINRTLGDAARDESDIGDELFREQSFVVGHIEAEIANLLLCFEDMLDACDADREAEKKAGEVLQAVANQNSEINVVLERLRAQ